MGIVNVTPDSFSDGGRFFDPDAAIAHALQLVEEGADILDVGGESTRPGADPVSSDEEIRRILPVIEAICRHTDVPVSIDTSKSAVARAATEAGAAMINDITAGRGDPAILDVAATSKAALCLMHMQGTPRTMQAAPHYDDLLGDIRSFLTDAVRRAEGAAVSRDRICIDPGIGFGKTTEQNIELLQHLDALTEIGLPILVGTSRKSFIGNSLSVDISKRLEPTLASLAIAWDRGARLFRVHDVAPAQRFLAMYRLLSPAL